MKGMKKRSLKNMIALMSATAMLAQLLSASLVFADDSQQSATKFVFDDNGIDVIEGDYTGYKISETALTINSAGTYEVSGTCSDGSIKVKKGVEGVNLILNGITLTSSDTAPLCFNKSSEVTLTANDNTVNSFADTQKNNDENYTDNENAENAVIKCKDGSSVTINGSGTINISANGKNGIKSGASTDEEGEAFLIIDGAEINIEAPVNDAVNAESLLNVKSGTLNISAADDALHSDYKLIIGENGGLEEPSINISSCYEGLEGANVEIYSGDIKIHSDDDGINAENSDLTDYSFTLDIYGGDIYVDAESGDGIDSNGTLTISGGKVEVFSTSSGDNAPLDSDGTFTITGGTVLAVGNSGMAQTPAAGSQNYIVFGAGQGGGMQQPGGAPGGNGDMQPPTGGNSQESDSGKTMKQMTKLEPESSLYMQNGQAQSGISISAGDELTLTDSENNTVYSAESVRGANYLLYSDSDLTESETYTLNINQTAAATATVSESANTQQPGNMPGSDNANTPPSPPSGQNGQPTPPSGSAPGGSSGAPSSYTAANQYSESTTLDGKTFASDGTDENSVLVTGGDVVIKNSTITRNSDDSTGGDNSSFYGVGAAALVTDGNLYIKDSEISTDAKGGAGIFAYGSGTAYAANTKITTEKDTSGGIHAAGGGILYAWNLDVTTSGESSAAIRSDRGGGKIVIDGGSYVSNGTGSPAVYSTADIAVNNAELTANGSEAVCIEGLNSLSLYNSTLSGNMKDDSQNDTTWTVIVYQSMSGDSEIGCGKFAMKDGKLISNNGGLFYTTNTESEFYLENVDITASQDSEFFLRATGNNNSRGWGTSGSNGADCLFTAVNQQMNGDIVWDKISTLKLYAADGSTLAGAVIQDSSYDGDGYAKLYIDESSSRVVTGDSTLSALYCAGNIKDADGRTVSIVKPDGTVLIDGDSEYTITTEEYSDTADMSGMGTYTEWSEYETDKPSYFADSSSNGSTGSGSSGTSSSSGSSSGKGTSSSSSGGSYAGSASSSKTQKEFFRDIKEDAWYYDAVKYMFDKGLMSGTSDNEFSPEMPVSRAMFVTVLYRTENEPEVNAENVFADVQGDEYYASAAAWAKENNIVSGVSDTEFAPDRNITREQMAAIMYRYAVYKAQAQAEDRDISLDYADADRISDYAKEAVGYCRAKGIMLGKDDNSFAPEDSAARAETAAVLQRFIETK